MGHERRNGGCAWGSGRTAGPPGNKRQCLPVETPLTLGTPQTFGLGYGFPLLPKSGAANPCGTTCDGSWNVPWDIN